MGLLLCFLPLGNAIPSPRPQGIFGGIIKGVGEAGEAGGIAHAADSLPGIPHAVEFPPQNPDSINESGITLGGVDEEPIPPPEAPVPTKAPMTPTKAATPPPTSSSDGFADGLDFANNAMDVGSSIGDIVGSFFAGMGITVALVVIWILLRNLRRKRRKLEAEASGKCPKCSQDWAMPDKSDSESAVSEKNALSKKAPWWRKKFLKK
ncbi:hypothetical protein V5O48_010887 [Marasmius crinis-equi]|uniref:Uncharacterized protein n=1 Tax=Marasmius crinis-equi TaxID=585013 RepID=A0ABR3F7J2_9AGAR